MSIIKKSLIGFLILIVLAAAAIWWLLRGDVADVPLADVMGNDPVLERPNAETVPTINIAEPIGWQADELPEAAEGLQVQRFADGLDNPRVIHALPNGDILVTLTQKPASDGGGGIRAWIARLLMSKAGANNVSPDTLMLLRDADGDGVAEQKTALTTALASPSGIAWADNVLYIANHDALVSFDYTLGSTEPLGAVTPLMDLPPAGSHWMRNIAIDPAGEKVFIAVGSDSNIGEKGMDREEGRAAIHEYDIARKTSRIYGAGMRNPNGLDWNPWTGELWTTVNERDMLGSDLVPDYLTNVPVGAQYGWPWVYWRDTIDERVDIPIPTFVSSYAREPEYAMGPHVAALGLAFTREGHRMGPDFARGAFVANHGSWNRKPASGYDVVFVNFDARGNPVGKPEPVLTGFLTGAGETRGRPTWVAWADDGALLVSDDTAGIIWRVIAPDAAPSAAMIANSGRSLPPRRELRGDPSAAFTDEFARTVEMPLP